jgi:hypothetical protein
MGEQGKRAILFVLSVVSRGTPVYEGSFENGLYIEPLDE